MVPDTYSILASRQHLACNGMTASCILRRGCVSSAGTLCAECPRQLDYSLKHHMNISEAELYLVPGVDSRHETAPLFSLTSNESTRPVDDLTNGKLLTSCTCPSTSYQISPPSTVNRVNSEQLTEWLQNRR